MFFRLRPHKKSSEKAPADAPPLSTDSDASVKHTFYSWYSDPRSLLILALLLMVAFSLPLFRYLNEAFPWMHPAFVAVLGGAITTVLVAPAMIYADPKYGFSSAVLAGLLVGEFIVYGAPLRGQTAGPVAITFFLYMHLVGLQEANSLWPEEYEQHRKYL